MSPSIVRNGLPVVTSVVATLILATGVPYGLVPEVAAAESVASADVGRCLADVLVAGACAGQTHATALAERARWQARDDAAARRASRQ